MYLKVMCVVCIIRHWFLLLFFVVVRKHVSRDRQRAIQTALDMVKPVATVLVLEMRHGLDVVAQLVNQAMLVPLEHLLICAQVEFFQRLLGIHSLDRLYKLLFEHCRPVQ